MNDSAEASALQAFAETDRGSLADRYERFVRAHAPDVRRAYGVFYTPPELVQAQVRWVAELLQGRLGIAPGFADARVGVVDPAAGSGAYPLAILQHVERGHGHAPADLRERMWLFEPLAGAAAVARAYGLRVLEQDVLTSAFSLDAPVAVCLGNPPYRRGPASDRALVADFVDRGGGLHAKNLFNAYVYFWQWCLRVLCRQRSGPAIVSLVTAASYLRGPAFAQMRATLRRELDELWLVDLEGDGLAARRTANVFPIRTPVAIAIGARFGVQASPTPADVHYTRLSGDRAAKLVALTAAVSLDDLAWQSAPRAWVAPLVPRRASRYRAWPALTELFPWQTSGAQLKRTWPIAPTPGVLRERWQRFLQASPADRHGLFGPTRDRDIHTTPPDLFAPGQRQPSLRALDPTTTCVLPMRYAYRAFDRHWVLPDARLGDFMRPTLWRTRGPRQIFVTSLLTNVLGPGPAAVATRLVPDLDHFRGSFGARAVIPLWRDAAGRQPNVAAEYLARLSLQVGLDVSAERLLAYCYGLLGSRGYVEQFEDELRVPGPRVPISTDGAQFERVADLGGRLLDLHTYDLVEPGRAHISAAIGPAMPRGFAYDAGRESLAVGEGAIDGVAPEVWAYSVSGLQVVPGWLRRRIVPRAGRTGLDAIRLSAWQPELSCELLELLWLVEATLALEPALKRALAEVISGRCAEQSWPAEDRSGEQVRHGFGAKRSGEDEALTLIAAELFE